MALVVVVMARGAVLAVMPVATPAPVALLIFVFFLVLRKLLFKFFQAHFGIVGDDIVLIVVGDVMRR